MKIEYIIGIIVGLALLAWIGWGTYTTLATEEPAYEVIEQEGKFELRQYEEQIWITTDYVSDNQAFRVLASYIFGGNEEGEKVAMTVPVVTDKKMAFVLPKTVNLDNAPTPDGQDMEITVVPPRTLATIKFSWFTPQEKVERKTSELLDYLQKNEIKTKGSPFLMRYNDPWTPPFMRRNEVGVEVVLDE